MRRYFLALRDAVFILFPFSFFFFSIFFNPGIIDEINRGLVATPMETLDQFITGEVTNHLFEDRKIPFSGVDLIALNIQRGEEKREIFLRERYP